MTWSSLNSRLGEIRCLNQRIFLYRVRWHERTDSAAKSVTDLAPNELKILYANLKPETNTFIRIKWFKFWNNNIQKKFVLIKPNLRK